MGGKQSPEIAKHDSRRAGKVDAPLCAKLEGAQWGEFKLGDLFGKATRGKRLKSDDRIPGSLPFVTAGEGNEGVSAFIGNDVDVFPANTITIDMFGSAKYRGYKYGADDHIAVVHTSHLPENAVKFVTTAIHQKSYTGEFNYGRNFYAKDADPLKIHLPIKDKNPDLDFMESFIAELEAERIAELESYLAVTGLKNYQLTAEEEAVLQAFRSGKHRGGGNINWAMFELGDLFEIRKGKRLIEEVLEDTRGNIALINQSTRNNMVARYSGLQGSNEIYTKNAITFAVNTKSLGYQPNDFYTIADVLFFKSSFLNPRIANYFMTTIKRHLPASGWDKIIGLSEMKSLKIRIPVSQNGQPDYAFMETLISAVQKLATKEVVLYVYRKIATTKEAV